MPLQLGRDFRTSIKPAQNVDLQCVPSGHCPLNPCVQLLHYTLMRLQNSSRDHDREARFQWFLYSWVYITSAGPARAFS